MDIIIEVRNLSKIYKLYDRPADRLKEVLSLTRKKYFREFHALRDVSFNIERGAVVGIVGKNGAGKSTLLKILTGVLTQSGGEVMVRGRISSLLELGAGFDPELTGIENIYLNGTIMGFAAEDMDERLQSILDFADIGDFVYQPVKCYSSGMFARLAFAVAINVEPDILIVDEALSVGDMAFQAKCYAKFKELSNKGITIVFVTHSVDIIIKFCQAAMLIDNGILLDYGDCKDVIEKYRKLIVNTKRQTKNSVKAERYECKKSKKEFLPINAKASNYGSREAEIIDFAIMDEAGEINNQIFHGTEYKIYMAVKFHVDIIEPIFAFTIRSVQGLELTGTNSMNLHQVFGKVLAGTVCEVCFTQKMILNAGQYLLALGCTKLTVNQLTVFNRIYDAVSIEVVTEKNATGIAFVNSEFEYEITNSK